MIPKNPKVSYTVRVALVLHLNNGSGKGEIKYPQDQGQVLCQKWAVENLRELEKPFWNLALLIHSPRKREGLQLEFSHTNC